MERNGVARRRKATLHDWWISNLQIRYVQGTQKERIAMNPGPELDAIVDQIVSPKETRLPLWKFPVPAYSTSADEIARLLEWLRNRDCDVSLESCGSAWCCHAAATGYTPMASTIPHALCLAVVAVAEAIK